MTRSNCLCRPSWIRVIQAHSLTWTTTPATGSSTDEPNVRQYHILPFISHARVCLALHESKAVTQYDGPPRRHSSDVWERRLVRSAQLFRTTLSCAVTAALAVVRFKLRLAKRLKQVEVKADVVGGVDGPNLTTAASVRRPPCGGWYCAYALSNGPLVV